MLVSSNKSLIDEEISCFVFYHSPLLFAFLFPITFSFSFSLLFVIQLLILTLQFSSFQNIQYINSRFEVIVSLHFIIHDRDGSTLNQRGKLLEKVTVQVQSGTFTLLRARGEARQHTLLYLISIFSKPNYIMRDLPIVCKFKIVNIKKILSTICL